jgi:pilus assembly protein CpaF
MAKKPPKDDPRYLHFKDELHRAVVDVVDLSRIDRWPEERLRDEIHSLSTQLAPRIERRLPKADVSRAADDVLAEIFGLGPLESLLKDETITEILVNGPDKVFIERDGQLTLAPVRFIDKAHIVRVIQRIAQRVGRRIDESSPMVDARLADGSRVNAVLPPLSLDSPVLSIRRFTQVFNADELVRRQSLTEEMIRFLEITVACRVNTLVSGGSGGGKTTLLNVLSESIPQFERLVTIEDAAELQLRQPHVVRMETRSANMEGHGQVTQRDLLRNALRMRPDRIILGEARGPEAVDMLQAMNTGHEGSLTTVHANGPRDSLSRLELMVGLAGVDIAVPILRGYIANAFSIIVHVQRMAGGERKVTRVSELVGLKQEDYTYRVRDIFRFKQTGVENGHAVGEFLATGYVPKRVLARFTAMGHPVDESFFAKRTLHVVHGPTGAEVEDLEDLKPARDNSDDEPMELIELDDDGGTA